MKILITGSNGFIGKNLSNYLSCRNLDILTPKREELDLLNKDLLNNYFNKHNPQVIFHLASKGISRLESNNGEINNHNIIMIKNIVSSIKENCRLIVAGSMAEYGKSGILKETDICIPKTAYAKSKLEITKFCLNKDNENKDIRICRIFGAYGFGELNTRLFPTLYKSFRYKKIANLSDGNQERDFIHVMDVCHCLMRISELPKDSCKKILNIGTGVPLSIKYVVKKYVESFGIDFDLIKFNSNPRSPGDANLLCADVVNLSASIDYVPPQRLKENQNIRMLFQKKFYRSQ